MTEREALYNIARAWDLIAQGRESEAQTIVPKYVADNWAASFATYAREQLRSDR